MVQKINLVGILLIVTTLIMGGTFVLKYSSVPPQVPLFYSQGDGDQQMADTYLLFLLPLVCYLLVFANMFIRNKFFSDVFLIERIVYYLNIAIILLTTFTFLKILLLIS